MEKLKDEVISNIRACLISFKGNVSVHQLEKDYRTLIGERIPYSKLGCKSMEEFLSHIPSISVCRTNGELFVNAKASEKSNHITDMVKKQKSVRRRDPPKSVRFNSYYSHAPQTKNWKPASYMNYRPKKFRTSERTAAVSHNQLVTRSPVKAPSVKSRVTVPPHSSFGRTVSAPGNILASQYNEPVKTPVEDSKPVSGILLHTPMRDSLRRKHSSNESEGPKVDFNLPASGVLMHTPLRDGHLQKPASSIISNNDQFGSTKVTNGSPVDLAGFANSLLHTSRQRITRMMSELTLDRDSGTSSPTSDVKCLPPVLTDDPIADLNAIVEFYKLGKIDVIHKAIKPKKRSAPTLYTCTITVDGQTYLSYPKDFFDEKSAQEYCAKQALDELAPKCIKMKSMLLSTSKDIKERIPPMLQAHFQGIWSWQIEADYMDKYMEQLPLNWLEIIDSCDCVAVERIQDRFVLRYCRPGTKGDKFCPSIPSDISVPSSTVQFGESNRLCAQITCIMSLTEVWCRQWDTPEFEAYNQMLILMEPYYTEQGYKHKADTILRGSYYIANYDSNWHRVRALEISEEGINCFLIDLGYEYLIEKTNIYNIRREFATSQAQAFVCRLAGLEDLYDVNVPVEKLSSYTGAEVILESAPNDTDDNDTDQSIPVVIYDYVTGNSMNEELLQFMTIESTMPVLQPHTVQTVIVSHLSEKGFVYVQIHSKGFKNLQTLLEYLNAEIEQNPPTKCLEQINKLKWTSNKDRLYLSKDKNDGHWYRSKILDMSPTGDFAQVYFVDRGDFEVAKVSEEVMYPLDKISDILHQFPAQCVRVKMSLEKIPNNFVEVASKLVKVNSPVLLKVVGSGEDGVPIGEFYKRSNDEGLFCINKSIMLEIEINTKNEEKENALKGTRSKLNKLTQLKDEAQKNNVPSGGSLQRPELPKEGEYFEVNIPFAVNPWNFFVQPYSSKDALNEMMISLQERYENATYSPLHISVILPGQIYATKHTDGIWYRTSVLKVINSGSISVFYCDFGYYSSLGLSQLIPLEPQFTSLPYQALKAKLSGIKPKNEKWSMEDCEHFNKLVEGKSFVSVLRDIEKDELYEFDPVLKLTLIDTSTDDDIFIDKMLIEQKKAIKAD